MNKHFNLRQTLEQCTNSSTSIHDTLESLPRDYDEDAWMTDLRSLLLPLKVWKCATSVALLIPLLEREGFPSSISTDTVAEQCIHIPLEESSVWALAEVQICGGQLCNVFLHRA